MDKQDKERREEYKKHEMEKEHKRKEHLKELDEKARKEEELKYEKLQEKHRNASKNLHHPVIWYYHKTSSYVLIYWFSLLQLSQIVQFPESTCMSTSPMEAGQFQGGGGENHLLVTPHSLGDSISRIFLI